MKKPAQHFGCGALFAFGFAAFAIMLAVESCSRSSPASPAQSHTPPASSFTPEEQEATRQRVAQALKEAQARWSYSVQNDDMSSRPIHSAILFSRNSFELDFPYQDPQRGTLHLRRHPKHGTDVIVSLERGQILCRFDGCRHDVRFDERNAAAWTMLEPKSNESDFVFVRDAQSFVRQMRESKLVRVQLKLFDEPPVTLEFDVSQFDHGRWLGETPDPPASAPPESEHQGRS